MQSKAQILHKALVDTESSNLLIIESIQDIKGKNIVKLDLRKLEDAPTDFFIICEGDSNTQVKAIAANIAKQLKDVYGVKPWRIEGSQNARWILIDYFDTVVHVFYKETRQHYDIEDLWNDADREEFHSI